jgi:hypothetical protein
MKHPGYHKLTQLFGNRFVFQEIGRRKQHNAPQGLQIIQVQTFCAQAS